MENGEKECSYFLVQRDSFPFKMMLKFIRDDTLILISYFYVKIFSVCQGCVDSLFYSNPLLLSSYLFHPSLLSLSSSFRLFSRYLFLFSHSALPLSLHRVNPVPPHAFICLSLSLSPFIPYLFCLSFSCHAFIPLLLSSLSDLIPLSAHSFIHFPVCQFSYFTDCLSETVLPNQCTKCHFQTNKQQFLESIHIAFQN